MVTLPEVEDAKPRRITISRTGSDTGRLSHMGPRVAFDVPAVVDGLASAPTIRVAMDPLSASRSVALFASPLRTPELIAARLGCDDGVGAPEGPRWRRIHWASGAS